MGANLPPKKPPPKVPPPKAPPPKTPAAKTPTPAPGQAAAKPAAPPLKAPPPRKDPGKEVLMVKSGAKVGVSAGGAKSGATNLQTQKTQSQAKGAQQAVQGARAEATERIEDAVLALPELKAVAEPALFTSFIERVAPKLVLAPTSLAILTSFANIDVTADRIAQVLRANPYYEFQFFRQIESLGKREELPSLEAAVVLLGMQNSRNLIVALQALRTVRGGHPEWDEKGKLAKAPNEIVKYALKTEEVLSGDKSGYADTAYAAGLLFDLLALMAEDMGEDKKKAMATIDGVYAHGLRSARIGVELAKLLPDFALKKYVFAACLIHDVGKIALSFLSADYQKFLEEIQKKELPRAVRHRAEQKRFEIDHALVGGLALHSFRIFKPIEQAVLHHHQPQALKAGPRSMYDLCALVCLASNMANHFRKIDKIDDPALDKWKTPDLKDFRLDARQLMSVTSKIQI